MNERSSVGWNWVLPAFPAVWAGIALWLGRITSPGWELTVAGVFIICGAWSAVNFFKTLGYAVIDMLSEKKAMDYKQSENYKIELLSHMNDTQIKALRSGHHLVNIIPGEAGPIEMLYGEQVYLYAAWYVLVRSTKTNVHPINQFQIGTYSLDVLGDHEVDDRQQVHNFHVWLVRYGYAYWGRGNTSASWCKGFNPDVVMAHLGLSRDSYADGTMFVKFVGDEEKGTDIPELGE